MAPPALQPLSASNSMSPKYSEPSFQSSPNLMPPCRERYQKFSSIAGSGSTAISAASTDAELDKSTAETAATPATQHELTRIMDLYTDQMTMTVTDMSRQPVAQTRD